MKEKEEAGDSTRRRKDEQDQDISGSEENT